MFFSRKTVTLTLFLILSAQPVLAEPTPEVDGDWLVSIRQLWEAVTSVVTGPDGVDGPASSTQSSLGWIDPSGLQGEAPSGFSNEPEGRDDAEPSAARHHGWIDPSGFAVTVDEQPR